MQHMIYKKFKDKIKAIIKQKIQKKAFVLQTLSKKKTLVRLELQFHQKYFLFELT